MMEKAKTTPKDFFMWAGAMVAFYSSVIAFLALMFDYINYAFPDPLRYYPADPYQGGVSYEMATLIVMVPVFLVLMRFIRRDIEKDESRREVWVRRWALVLTLFVAGISAVIDLIVLVTSFLNGESLTAPFLLKIAVVFLVAAAVFMHFITDLWGYWATYPKRAQMVGYAAGLLVVLTIIAGFFIIGTPAQARIARVDAQKISDMQSIQWQIVNYYQQKQTVPATLDQLQDPISGFIVPMQPETNIPYEYKVHGKLSFELCADFGGISTRQEGLGTSEPVSLRLKGGDLGVGSWQHAEGNQCFLRTIDPELYPVTNPKAL